MEALRDRARQLPGRGGRRQPLLRPVRAGRGLPLAAASAARPGPTGHRRPRLPGRRPRRAARRRRGRAARRSQPAPAGVRADRRCPAGRGGRDRVGGSRRRRGNGRRQPLPTGARRRPTTPRGERRTGRGRPAHGGRTRRRDRRLPTQEFHRALDRPGRPPGQSRRLGSAHHALRPAAGVRRTRGHLRPDRRPAGQLADLPGGRPTERSDPQPRSGGAPPTWPAASS